MDAIYSAVEVTATDDRRRALLVLDRSASSELVGRISSEITLDLVYGELPDLVSGSTVRINLTIV